MKKVISLFAVIVALFLNLNMAFADNSQRIKELQQEAQLLLEERQKHLSEITRIEVRLYEINGAVKELAPKDSAAMSKDEGTKKK